MTVYGKVGPAQGLTFNFEIKIVDDLKEVAKRAHQANVRNLYKASALVRTTARRLIKRSKKASTSGNPPHHHTEPGLKGLMKFDVDTQAAVSVVGPMKFASAKGHGVPHVLEFGGVAVNHRGEKYHLAPRPYMRPAEAKVRPKYPQFWKDSI